MVLTVIVFVHEMGHYLVARWNGVAIQTFSLGFGPEVVGFTDRHDTRWRISAIPLGGYVRFVGDMNAASLPDPEAVAALPAEEQKRLFINKNVWRRIAVVAAGPLANVIFTFVVTYALILGYGQYTIPPVISDVARRAASRNRRGSHGRRLQDHLGRRLFSVRGFEDFQRLISTAPGRRSVTIVLERDAGADQSDRARAFGIGRRHRSLRQRPPRWPDRRQPQRRFVGRDALSAQPPIEAVGLTVDDQICFIVAASSVAVSIAKVFTSCTPRLPYMIFSNEGTLRERVEDASKIFEGDELVSQVLAFVQKPSGGTLMLPRDGAEMQIDAGSRSRWCRRLGAGNHQRGGSGGGCSWCRWSTAAIWASARRSAPPTCRG